MADTEILICLAYKPQCHDWKLYIVSTYIRSRCVCQLAQHTSIFVVPGHKHKFNLSISQYSNLTVDQIDKLLSIIYEIIQIKHNRYEQYVWQLVMAIYYWVSQSIAPYSCLSVCLSISLSAYTHTHTHPHTHTHIYIYPCLFKHLQIYPSNWNVKIGASLLENPSIFNVMGAKFPERVMILLTVTDEAKRRQQCIIVLASSTWYFLHDD